MKIKIILIIFLTLLVFVLIISMLSGSLTYKNKPMSTSNIQTKTAMFAGGCFWCVEADFEKLKGIVSVVSGYAGGNAENPNYENYANGGHREVVEITYDPSVTSYQSLVEHLVFYGDPTDATGSFSDRGVQYAPAIYVENDEERKIAREVIEKVNNSKIYDKPVSIEVLPRSKFWPAEVYHQDYYKKNPLRYNLYRQSSGRDRFINEHKNKAAEKGFLQNYPISNELPADLDFKDYQKPSDETLKNNLSDLQYKVTQEEGAERAFENEYNDNKADGIYVDRISGEPLFSSRDKYDSGTGWPSFVKPIDPERVVLREKKGFLSTITEVRSRYADSHLGHVFDDGPKDRGGKRYCLNSAALLFIPKEEMEVREYGKLMYLFD